MQNKFENIFKDYTTSEFELFSIADSILHERYGAIPDEKISDRFKQEWRAIKRWNLAPDIAALYEIVKWLKANGYAYRPTSCTGSSFILYLLGITFGNPLPAHTICTKCKSIVWHELCADGFDISTDCVCENDNSPLIADGHDIPWQTLFGYGEFIQAIQIDLPKIVYKEIRDILSSHWIATINQDFPLICNDEVGIDVSNLSFSFVLNQDNISPSFYERNASARDYEAIVQNWKHYADYCQTDENVDRVEYYPDTVAEVIAVIGLLHSDGAWDEVADMMVKKMYYQYNSLICFRDDVFTYLSDHGYPEIDAWQGMESVRKGKHLLYFNNEICTSRDQWVIGRLGKIEYLSPKAQAVESLIFKLKTE